MDVIFKILISMMPLTSYSYEVVELKELPDEVTYVQKEHLKLGQNHGVGISAIKHYVVIEEVPLQAGLQEVIELNKDLPREQENGISTNCARNSIQECLEELLNEGTKMSLEEALADQAQYDDKLAEAVNVVNFYAGLYFSNETAFKICGPGWESKVCSILLLNRETKEIALIDTKTF